jgi:hypothetical protein
MNTIIVHNPTQVPVRDYPVRDPRTKETQLWSIMPGETLEFPDYVATHFLDVYNFLQKVMTKEQLQAEQEQQKKLDAGMHFSQVKIIESKKEVSQPTVEPKPMPAPLPQPGFTNQNMQVPYQGQQSPNGVYQDEPQQPIGNNIQPGFVNGPVINPAVAANQAPVE